TDQVDQDNTGRGMIGSKGAIHINPRWTLGWDAMVQSDKAFAYRYGLEGYADYNKTDQIYLTGLHDRNYFDLRLYKFHVQEGWRDSDPNSY
ncbi:LPS assembly protein LptD, partial [Streptococcus suis]